jgi:hypothetical protein
MAAGNTRRGGRVLDVLACASTLLLASAVTAEEKKPQIIGGWGTLTDRTGDCVIKKQDGKLSVTVPGGRYSLNASVGGMKAPRILKEVEGDFTIEVKVEGDFKPGEIPAGVDVRPFHGAGLLVWQDAGNYVRLERNVYWVREQGVYVCYPPLLEYFEEGEYQDTNPAPALYDRFFTERSTWLKLARWQDKLTASYSHDGKEWIVVKTIPVELSKKLRVGVVAVNTAAKPFAVEFENLKVSTKN